jgi:hypothetical protein
LLDNPGCGPDVRLIAGRLDPSRASVCSVDRRWLALTFPHWALEGADPDRNPVELEGRGTIVSRRHRTVPG